MNLQRVLSLVFSIVLTATLALAAEMEGVFMVVKGDIKVQRKGGAIEVVKVGTKVMAGDAIIAGKDSRAKVVMTDKNVLNISPETKLVIEKYENNGKDKKSVELSVPYGKIRASVEQKYDGDSSRFNVKTPAAVAGVRGTDFLTSYNPTTRQSQIVTFSGTVAVGQPGQNGQIINPVFVQPGQSTSAEEGKKPSAPVAIPPEDLKKMNTESSADLGKAPSPTAAPSAEAVEEKKDEQKPEDKKELAKDSAEPKPEMTAEKAPEKSAESAPDKKSAESNNPGSTASSEPKADQPAAGNGPAAASGPDSKNPNSPNAQQPANASGPGAAPAKGGATNALPAAQAGEATGATPRNPATASPASSAAGMIRPSDLSAGTMAGVNAGKSPGSSIVNNPGIQFNPNRNPATAAPLAPPPLPDFLRNNGGPAKVNVIINN